MSEMIAKVGGHVVFTKPVVEVRIPEYSVKSRWSGDLEESRKSIVDTMVRLIAPAGIMTKLTLVTTHSVLAAAANADKIRQSFQGLVDVFTALTEPILWFYALSACVLIATKNKQTGWDRLKQVGYAYAGIALLPTFFTFLRWIAETIKTGISF